MLNSNNEALLKQMNKNQTLIIERLEEENQQLNEELQQLEYQIDTLKQGNNDQLQQSEQLAITLRQELLTYQSQNTEMQQKYAQSVMQNQLLQSKYDKSTQQYKDKIAEVKSQLKLMNQKNQDYQKEIFDLHQQKMIKKVELTKVIENFTNADDEIKKLKAGLEIQQVDYENKIEEYTNLIQDKDEEINQLIQVNTELNEANEKLQLEFDQVVTSLEKERNSTEEQLLVIQKERNKFEEETNEQYMTLKQLRKQIEISSCQNNDLSKQLDHFLYKSQVNEQIQSERYTSEMFQLREANNELEKRIKTIKVLNSNLSDQIKLLEGEKDDLHQQFLENQNILNLKSSKIQELDQLLHYQNAGEEQAKNNAQTLKESLEKENTILVNQLQELQIQLEQLKEMFQFSKTKLDEEEQQRQQQKQIYENAISKQNTNARTLEQSNQDLILQNNKLINEIKQIELQYQKDCSLVCQKNSEFEIQILELQQIIYDLRSEESKKDGINDMLNHQSSSQLQEITEVKEQHQQYQDNIISHFQQLAIVLEKCSNQQMITVNHTDIGQIFLYLEDQMNIIKDRFSEMSILQQNYEEKISQLQRSFNEQRLELESKSSELVDFQKTTKNLETDNIALFEQLKEAENYFQQQLNQQEQKIQDLENFIQASKLQVTELLSQLVKSQETVNSDKEQIKILTDEITALTQKLRNNEESLAKLAVSLQEKEQLIENSSQQHEENSVIELCSGQREDKDDLMKIAYQSSLNNVLIVQEDLIASLQEQLQLKIDNQEQKIQEVIAWKRHQVFTKLKNKFQCFKDKLLDKEVLLRQKEQLLSENQVINLNLQSEKDKYQEELKILDLQYQSTQDQIISLTVEIEKVQQNNDQLSELINQQKEIFKQNLSQLQEDLTNEKEQREKLKQQLTTQSKNQIITKDIGLQTESYFYKNNNSKETVQQQQLMNMISNNTFLSEENLQLQNQYREFELQNKSLIEKNNKLQKQIEIHKETINQLSQQNKQEVKQNLTLMQQIDPLQRQIEILTRESRKTQQLISEYEKQYGKLSLSASSPSPKKYQNFDYSQVQKLESQISQRNIDLENQQKKYEEEQERINNNHKEILHNLETQVNQLNQDLEREKQQSTQLMNEIQDLQKQFVLKNSKELQYSSLEPISMLISNQQQCIELKNSNCQSYVIDQITEEQPFECNQDYQGYLEQKNEELKLQLHKIQQKFDEQEDKYEQLTVQVCQLGQQNEQLLLENHQQQLLLASIQPTDEQIIDIELIQSKAKLLEQQLQIYQDENTKLKQELQDGNSNQRALKLQLAELSHNIKIFESQIKQQENAIQSKDLELHNNSTLILQLKNLLLELQEKIDSLQLQYNIIADENNNTKQQQIQNINLINQLKDKNNILSDQNITLKAEYQANQEEFASQNKEFQFLMNQSLNQKKEIETYQAKISQLMESHSVQIIELNQQNTSLIANFTQQNNNLMEKVSKLEQGQEDSLKQQAQLLQQQNEDLIQISQLTTEHKQLVQQIFTLKQSILNIKNENLSYYEQIQQLHLENDTLGQQLIFYYQEKLSLVNRTNKERINWIEQISINIESIEKLSYEIKFLEEQLQKLQNKIVDELTFNQKLKLENQILVQQIENERSAYENTLSQLNEEIHSLQPTLTNHENTIITQKQQFFQEIQSLEEDLKKQRVEVELIQSVLEEQISGYKQQILELQGQISILKSKDQEHIKQILELKNQIESQEVNFHNQKEQFEYSLKVLETTNYQLQQHLTNSKDVDSINIKLQEKINKQGQNIIELKDELEKQKQQDEIQKLEINQLQEMIKQHIQNIHNLEQIQSQLQGEFEQKNELMQFQITDLQDKYSADIAKLQIGNAELQQENAKCSLLLSQLQVENHKLLENKSLNEKQFEIFQETLNNKQNELQKLQQLLQVSKVEIESQQKMIDTSRLTTNLQITTLQGEVQTLKQQLDEKTNDLLNNQIRMQNITDNFNKDKISWNEQLELEKQQLIWMKQNSEKHLSQIQEQHENEMAKFQLEIQRFENEKQELDHQLLELTDQLHNYEEQIFEKVIEIENMKKTVDLQEQSLIAYQNKIAQIMNQNAILQMNYEELKDKFENDIEKLTREKKNLEDTKLQYEQQTLEGMESNQELKKQLQILLAQLKEKEISNTNIQQLVYELQEINTILSGKIENYQKNSDDLNKKCQELEILNSLLTNEKDLYKEKLNKLEYTSTDKQQAILILEQQHNSQQQQLEQLKSSNINLCQLSQQLEQQLQQQQSRHQITLANQEQQLLKQIDVCSETINQQLKQIQYQSQKIDQFRQSEAQMKNDQKQLENSKILEMLAFKESYEQQIERLTEQVGHLEEMNKQYSCEIVQLNNLVKKQLEDRDSEIKTKYEDYEQLQVTIKLQKEQIERLHQSNMALLEENASLQEQINLDSSFCSNSSQK